jgi:hypothetical protein
MGPKRKAARASKKEDSSLKSKDTSAFAESGNGSTSIVPSRHKAEKEYLDTSKHPRGNTKSEKAEFFKMLLKTIDLGPLITRSMIIAHEDNPEQAILDLMEEYEFDLDDVIDVFKGKYIYLAGQWSLIIIS